MLQSTEDYVNTGAKWHIIKAKSETKHTDLHLKLSCHLLDGQKM